MNLPYLTGSKKPTDVQIFNSKLSDDWSLECNTNKTPDVNDETTSKKKDVWNIICQGEKVTYPFLIQIQLFAVYKRFEHVEEVKLGRL